MASALGVLKWQPQVFWDATFYEYTAAMKGHLASQGVDVSPPMTKEEALALKAQLENKAKAPMRGHKA